MTLIKVELASESKIVYNQNEKLKKKVKDGKGKVFRDIKKNTVIFRK